MSPQATVIVRTQSRPQYLKDCLSSIGRQSVGAETIIINDGGNPLELPIEELLCGKPYRLVEYPVPRGRAYASNTGLKLVRTKYACFLDDDDIFYPGHIETLCTFLENSTYRVAYSDALQANQEPWAGSITGYLTADFELKHSRDYCYARLLEENYIPILCVMFETALVTQGKGFDTAIEVLEDWDFWLQLAKREPFHHIEEITCEYRVRNDGSNTTGRASHLWLFSQRYLKQKHNLNVQIPV